MNPSEPTPLHCRPEAFEALAEELDGLDTTRGLLRCAVAVSMHRLPDADADEVERQIEQLAESVAERVRSDQPRALLAHAHEVLFDEARFAGNTTDYYHPFNSYMPKVLETKRGNPISLALLYKCVLESLGVRVLGINVPGHFLAGVVGLQPDASHPLAAKPLLIDPFHHGRTLSREEAFARIEEIAGGSVLRDEALLRPATHVEWITRLIQNLVAAFDRLGKRDDMAAMLELRALVESIR